jgi:hypothetical protein
VSRRLLRLIALLAVLPASSAFAALDASFTHAIADAYSKGQTTTTPIVTPSPGGGLDVSVSAASTDEYDLGPLYSGDFSYSASFLATGFLDFGFAAANVQAMARSAPASIESIPPGSPRANPGEAAIGGAMDLRFAEVGVVTGSTPGAPVRLTLHVGVRSNPVAVGGSPVYPRLARVTMYARVIDNDAGFVGIEREAVGSEIVTFELDTAVGHHLSIEGRFRAHAEGRAGGPQNVFAPEYTVQIAEAVGGFWMDVPDGVGFEAPSLVDYTVDPIAVPEPSRPLSAIVGAAILIALARRE